MKSHEDSISVAAGKPTVSRFCSDHFYFPIMDEIFGYIGSQPIRVVTSPVTLADQIATALEAGCEAFLTNDTQLKRVTEITILAVSDLDWSLD